MKGMIGLALVILGFGVIYVLVRRPSVAPKAITGPSTSNAVFGVIGSLGGKLIGAFSSSGTDKVAPPSGTSPVINEGTYSQGPSDVEGNTLTNSSGDTLTYGTD